MNNVMLIEGHKAVIEFDPGVEMFRGSFLGLNGGADFYAETVRVLHREGKRSLRVFLEVCKEKGIEPYKQFSGKFNVRIDADLHAATATAAAASGVSMNTLVRKALLEALKE